MIYAFLHRYRSAPMLATLAGLLIAAPVLAQNANFGSFTLSDGTSSASANGYTSGFFPLSSIAGRDRHSNICTGYAAEAPDHVMVLQQNLDSLTVQVNSGGNDTTLLIQGPGADTIRCGQDTSRRNPDATVVDGSWAAGTYRIWVGTHTQGQRYNYSLSAGQ